jgi:uncharacterized membrane protein
MAARKTKKILYLGDWVIHLGPHYVESPFGGHMKGTDIFFYGRRLVEALQSSGEFVVTSMASWDIYNSPAGRYEELLATHEIVIISDVTAACMHLRPQFFKRDEQGREVLVMPDRLRLTRDWVAAGGGMMMLGGWSSFSGHMGKGSWGRTCMAEALPVECLATDDLIESSEGYEIVVKNRRHPITKGLPWRSFQPILGYNETRPRAAAEVLVEVKGSGHPLLACQTYGKGRVAVYTSDPVPHWGLNFWRWVGYDRFWLQVCDWVLGK